MSKIKSLTVKTSFKVGLGDIEAPKKVIEQLEEMNENCDTADTSSFDFAEATEWLRDNIHLRDCFECEWEVERIEGS